MIESIWDSQTGHELAQVKDQRDVFRTGDGKHIGTYRDGAVYDLSGNLVCHLGLLEQGTSSEPLPVALKTLLQRGDDD